jgi:hypothetical protein
MLMRATAAEPARASRRLGDDAVSVTIILLGARLELADGACALTKVRAEAVAMIV